MRANASSAAMVSATWAAVALEGDAANLSPDDAFTALMAGKTVLDLSEGLQLRRVRVMGANRIELTGFTDAMRERLQRLWSLPRDHLMEAADVRPDRRDGRGDSRQGDGALSVVARLRAGSGVRWRAMRRELAHRLAREAEAVCRHYLSNGRRQGNYWLVGDVEEHAGPLDVRAAEGRRIRQGRGGQMDRCGDGRSWRSARRDSRELRPCRLPATSSTRHGAFSACHDRSQNRNGAVARTGADWIAGIGAATVRHVAVDCGHCRGDLSAQSWHYGFARSREVCASTRAAITGPTMTRRPRLGRR